MIAQVDEALCRLIGRQLPAGATVRLDTPKPAWQTDTPSPTVELFLFGLHGAGVRSCAGPPTTGCSLSYLITARARELDVEHRLLDLALCTVIRAQTLPPDCLPDDFGPNRTPIRLEIDDTDPTSLWPSLAMPARAAFVATVTVQLGPW